MKKKKYIYNPKKLKYEEYKRGGWSILFNISLVSGLATVLGIGLFYFISHAFPSAKEKSLQGELSKMEFKYEMLNDQVATMSKVLSNIRDRDDNIYKMMFGMEPMDDGLWLGGIGGQEINQYNSGEQLRSQTEERVSRLERQLVLESKALEEVQELALEKQLRLAATPSIKPVPKEVLKYDVKLLSGFGMRVHPIQKIKRLHAGIDFTCPKGTSIHATANGTISKVMHSKTGYGRHVIINHGFGYETLYAHMDKIEVKEGQKVKRGQHIGTVGNSGASTGPHVHYEVHVNGKRVNPIDYVMDGLSPAEYAELVRLSKIQNQSFD